MTATKKTAGKTAGKAPKPDTATTKTAPPPELKDPGASEVKPHADEANEALAHSAIDKAAAAAEQERRDAEGETETFPMTLSAVNVIRDNTKTRLEVYEHEVPILELLHKPENIEPLGERTVDVADFDPDSEIDRLLRKYGRNGERAVLEVYGRDGRKLAERVGYKYRPSRDRNRTGEQAMMIDHAAGVSAGPGATKTLRMVKRDPSAGSVSKTAKR